MRQYATHAERKLARVRERHSKEAGDRLALAAMLGVESLLKKLKTARNGLHDRQVKTSRDLFGSNVITRGKKKSLFRRLIGAFINPFTAILLGLAAVSACTDIIWAAPGESNPKTVIIIMTMVMISGVLRFVQEARSGAAAENLLKMIKTTTCVQRRRAGKTEIPLEDVVVGDIVYLAAGDMVPADIRLIQAKDLFVSQSALTGESVAVEKTAHAIESGLSSMAECPNLAFMGSNVVSGSAMGVTVATGDSTLFGEMAKRIHAAPVQTSFEKGINQVSWVLIRFMLIMVPCVLFINGFTKGDWVDASLFALSVAVGLTPEMLPMIVTTCLARGAVRMSREKTIIKNLNSIQNLGSMDVLCTDKTGTLTLDKVVLQYHLNIHGQEDTRVLRHAFLNSYYQTGLKNLMDFAIIERTLQEQKANPSLVDLSKKFTKVDEIPFDFERRRMSVVVSNGKTQMITKGAVEEMLSICGYAEYNGAVMPLSDEIRNYILKKVEDLNNEGMRVIAVAQKNNPSAVGAFSTADESDMVLMGYLAFLDPPKESTEKALKALHEHGVGVKVLTGDNDKVTRSVCRKLQIPVEHMLLGSDIARMEAEELRRQVERVSVFAKLSPAEGAGYHGVACQRAQRWLSGRRNQ